MAKRRFGLLERKPGDSPPPRVGADEPGGAPDGDATGVRARRLERDGQLRLDESGPADTDFCRYCRFENRAGQRRCLNCGSPLGGPDQEAFDDEVRAQRERQRLEATGSTATASGAANGAAAPEAGPSSGSAPSVADLDVTRLLREADRHEPGFGTVIATGVLAACIFALVSIPVRWIFSSAHGGFSAGGVLELLLLVGVTVGVYAAVRRPLSRL